MIFMSTYQHDLSNESLQSYICWDLMFAPFAYFVMEGNQWKSMESTMIDLWPLFSPSGKVWPENGCHIVVPWEKSFLWIGDSIWLRHVWSGHLWRARVAWAALRGARAPFLMSMSFNRWISPCKGPQKWFQLISSFPIIYDNRGPFGCHSRALIGYW